MKSGIEQFVKIAANLCVASLFCRHCRWFAFQIIRYALSLTSFWSNSIREKREREWPFPKYLLRILINQRLWRPFTICCSISSRISIMMLKMNLGILVHFFSFIIMVGPKRTLSYSADTMLYNSVPCYILTPPHLNYSLGSAHHSTFVVLPAISYSR